MTIMAACIDIVEKKSVDRIYDIPRTTRFKTKKKKPEKKKEN